MMISNRKLYRLGVGVALLMSCFLVNLVYHDIFHRNISDVTGSRRLAGNSKPPEMSDVRDNEGVSSSQRPQAFETVSNWHQLEPADPSIVNSKEATTVAVASFKKKENGNNSFLSNSSSISLVSEKTNKVSIDTFKKDSEYASHSVTSKTKNSFLNFQQSHHLVNVNELIPGNLSARNTHSKSIPGNRNRLTRDRPKTNNLINGKIIFNSKLQSKSKNGYLVYLCEDNNWCGGWGDRQRGLTSLYHMSKLLGREYKIIMNTPCNLTNFYVPGKVNWVWNPVDAGPARKVFLNSISKAHFNDQLVEGDFNVRFPHDVIYLKTNQDLIKAAVKNPIYAHRINADKSLQTKKSRFRSAWNDLMQPSQTILLKIQKLVGAARLIDKGLIPKPLGYNISATRHNNDSSSLSSLHSSSPPKPLICAHVRMGKNPTIPMDEQWDSFQPDDIPKLLHFLKSKDTQNNAQFFLATDYEQLRGEFGRFFGHRLITNGGKIIHIDRQRNTPDACVGFGAAILDQLVLSLCDVLVTSRSGFSIHASYISNSSHPVYIMEDRVIKLLKSR